MRLKIISNVMLTVKYDGEQAQEEGKTDFHVYDAGDETVMTGTIDLELGDNIPVEVADSITHYLARENYSIFGFVVPEYLLPSFAAKYSDSMRLLIFNEVPE